MTSVPIPERCVIVQDPWTTGWLRVIRTFKVKIAKHKESWIGHAIAWPKDGFDFALTHVAFERPKYSVFDKVGDVDLDHLVGRTLAMTGPRRTINHFKNLSSAAPRPSRGYGKSLFVRLIGEVSDFLVQVVNKFSI